MGVIADSIVTSFEAQKQWMRNIVLYQRERLSDPLWDELDHKRMQLAG